MSSAELQELIDAGNAFASLRFYSIGLIGIYFYDYFLTLADEIKYAWNGKKSWVFGLFLVNRYLPMLYQLWYVYVGGYSTTFHQDVLVSLETIIVAQVVLTLRIYAVTGKNRMITSCFCVITLAQLVIGLYITIHAAKEGAQPIIPIPLPVYMICFLVESRSLEIGFTVISLVYDFLAFSVIVYLVVRSNVYKVPIPSLLRTIAQDATHYFLVIFTSHFVFMVFLLFADPKIRLIPAVGNTVYIPTMISRLLLSLKKASASQEQGWSFGELSTRSVMKFAERPVGAATKDEINLGTFASKREEIQSQRESI